MRKKHTPPENGKFRIWKRDYVRKRKDDSLHVLLSYGEEKQKLPYKLVILLTFVKLYTVQKKDLNGYQSPIKPRSASRIPSYLILVLLW